jgi:pimeloyl-ACP methyl ester carboxylesterase
MHNTDSSVEPEVAESVKSTDGTTISYRTVGQSPALIVIPGALSMAVDYSDLANALASTFTIHTIERRGRGLSGPQGSLYGIARECEDVTAVQVATGAEYLFGHSYGGLVALETARHNRRVRKLAVYEPGVSVDGRIPMGWIAGYERKLAQNRPLDAFVEFCIAFAPERAQRMPRWVMKLGILVALGRRERESRLRLLAQGLREHKEVARLDNSYANYREVAAPALLMSGGKGGGEWVEAAIGRLSQVLLFAEQRTFPHLDHFGPDKTGPGDVAQAVAAFLVS